MGSCCGKPKPEEETNQATDRVKKLIILFNKETALI